MAKKADPIKTYDIEFLRCRTIDRHRWELTGVDTKYEGDYLAVEWEYECDRCATCRRTTVNVDGTIIKSRYSYDAGYHLSEQHIGHKVTGQELRAEIVRRATTRKKNTTTTTKKEEVA
jgi:hypothetical protein